MQKKYYIPVKIVECTESEDFVTVYFDTGQNDPNEPLAKTKVKKEAVHQMDTLSLNAVCTALEKLSRRTRHILFGTDDIVTILKCANSMEDIMRRIPGVGSCWKSQTSDIYGTVLSIDGGNVLLATVNKDGTLCFLVALIDTLLSCYDRVENKELKKLATDFVQSLRKAAKRQYLTEKGIAEGVIMS